MRTVRSIRTATLAGFVLSGLGVLGGCGGDSAGVNGAQIKQDSGELQNREKMISDMYKKNPPNPTKKN